MVTSLIPIYRFDFLCVFYFIIAYFVIALFTIQLKRKDGPVGSPRNPIGRPVAETSFRLVEFAEPKHLFQFIPVSCSLLAFLFRHTGSIGQPTAAGPAVEKCSPSSCSEQTGGSAAGAAAGAP